MLVLHIKDSNAYEIMIWTNSTFFYWNQVKSNKLISTFLHILYKICTKVIEKVIYCDLPWWTQVFIVY